jgi:hypothetical protein
MTTMKLTDMFYTYIHRKASDGSVFYVGKGISSRANTMHGRNKFWHNIENKHGRTVEICARWKTEQEALDHERLLIACFKDMGCELSNLTDGGLGTSGRKMPPDQLAKHTTRVREQAKSQEWRDRIAESLKGEKHPRFGKPAPNKGKPILPHVQAAMMAKHVNVNPDAMAKMIASKTGVKLTADHKKKLSAASKGKPKSEAMKEKLAKSKTGYKYSEEAKEKMRQSRLAYLAKQKLERKNEIN